MACSLEPQSHRVAVAAIGIVLSISGWNCEAVSNDASSCCFIHMPTSSMSCSSLISGFLSKECDCSQLPGIWTWRCFMFCALSLTRTFLA